MREILQKKNIRKSVFKEATKKMKICYFLRMNLKANLCKKNTKKILCEKQKDDDDDDGKAKKILKKCGRKGKDGKGKVVSCNI